MTRSELLHRWEQLPLEKVTEMVARKVVAGADDVVAQTYLKKGALVPRHAHAVEQMVYVLQGALRAIVGDEEIMVREGELLRIPRRAAHQAEALDDTFVLDIRAHDAGIRF
jgi:quercetin dioxygenase-like cupin family protein